MKGNQMALQPLKGWGSFTTHHCVTGSMRRIYEFHGYPISEDLLLGLGAGVGFVYWHMKGTQPFYGGRANVARPGEEGLEKTIGKRTGVTVQSIQTGSASKAEQALLDLLTAGEPVMLQVDMGFLPYFHFPEEYHFGGHVIVAAGYDPKVRQALVADRDRKLHRVSLQDLARARGSQFKPFPPRHTWYTYDFSGKRPPESDEVWQAIREATLGMLEPPITNLGVKGIRTAVARTRKWPEMMDEEELRRTCFNIFIFIDAIGGTGGGIFRYMYGRFLKEAANITGDMRLVQVGQDMQGIGDQWQAVARIFKRAYTAPDPAGLLPKATTLMLDIADCEQAAWEKLRQIAGS
jgi:hypothetical protein